MPGASKPIIRIRSLPQPEISVDGSARLSGLGGGRHGDEHQEGEKGSGDDVHDGGIPYSAPRPYPLAKTARPSVTHRHMGPGGERIGRS